ncbi:alpha/beta hydrolase [Chondrinema litorale]|uniref:alpha/beta hydrolase n=1 Tax=Chondrinema litorale TaxID=2994555 RepID=UPI002542D0EC|nr:alpha/beta hydrolase [Chondrinema litorale]UZR95018.1 alpha/beta hydrolase [Chondrinema litorale]
MQNDSGNTWIKSKIDSNKPKAVFILVHGLNNQAKLMYPFADAIAAEGYSVYVPVLDGHANDYAKFKVIEKEDWLCNIKSAYEIALAEAERLNCPLAYIGFSLGGLLGSLAKSEGFMPKVEKLILLAPALEMTFFSSLIRPLLRFNLQFGIPSRAPGAYRAHSFMPVKAYKTLFELKKQLDRGVLEKLNIPTLLFIDKKDELVSFKKLMNFISLHQLSNWNVKILLSKKNRGIHHMIADPYYAGDHNWRLMVDETCNFFTNS